MRDGATSCSLRSVWRKCRHIPGNDYPRNDTDRFGNGTTQTLSWTTRYFPSENKLTAPGTLADYSYGEDHVGNITAVTDKVNANYDRAFAYDDLNRLTTANSGTSLWGTASGNGYTYDAMGNIKTLKLGSTRSDTFSYSGALPKISSVNENGSNRAVSYDAFGNETGDGKSTFTYSPRELTATDSRFISAYYYDGFRRRMSTTLSSGGDHRDSFFDPSLHLLAETAQFTTGNPIGFKYVWLGDRPVAQVDSGGTHWTFADHLGTPLIQTSSTPPSVGKRNTNPTATFGRFGPEARCISRCACQASPPSNSIPATTASPNEATTTLAGTARPGVATLNRIRWPFDGRFKPMDTRSRTLWMQVILLGSARCLCTFMMRLQAILSDRMRFS